MAELDLDTVVRVSTDPGTVLAHVQSRDQRVNYLRRRDALPPHVRSALSQSRTVYLGYTRRLGEDATFTDQLSVEEYERG